MIHLTETGYHAGRRLCLTDRNDGARNVHAAYAPLDNPEFRANLCPHCLKVWALEAYEDGDVMPDYIESIRNEVAA
jgi:hypothetical protein